MSFNSRSRHSLQPDADLLWCFASANRNSPESSLEVSSYAAHPDSFDALPKHAELLLRYPFAQREGKAREESHRVRNDRTNLGLGCGQAVEFVESRFERLSLLGEAISRRPSAGRATPSRSRYGNHRSPARSLEGQKPARSKSTRLDTNPKSPAPFGSELSESRSLRRSNGAGQTYCQAQSCADGKTAFTSAQISVDQHS